MVILILICLAAVAVAWEYTGIGKKKDISKKTKIIARTVIIIAIILAIVFLVVSIVNNSGGSESEWDKLSEEEKDWYRDNYGNGQYEKYQDAIDDYKNKNK